MTNILNQKDLTEIFEAHEHQFAEKLSAYWESVIDSEVMNMAKEICREESVHPEALMYNEGQSHESPIGKYSSRLPPIWRFFCAARLSVAWCVVIEEAERRCNKPFNHTSFYKVV